MDKNKTGLTKEKKEILKSAMGAASSETIDLNKIRDEYRDDEYRRLDITKLRSKKSSVMSSEESLKDIVPIDWSEDVLSGKTKVIVDSDFKQFIQDNKEKIYKIAEQNTTYNSDGQATISKDDPYFNEDEWEEHFRELDKVERYCPISESLEESLKEMKLMREGKLPKKTWDEMKALEEIRQNNKRKDLLLNGMESKPNFIADKKQMKGWLFWKKIRNLFSFKS